MAPVQSVKTAMASQTSLSYKWGIHWQWEAKPADLTQNVDRDVKEWGRRHWAEESANQTTGFHFPQFKSSWSGDRVPAVVTRAGACILRTLAALCLSGHWFPRKTQINDLVKSHSLHVGEECFHVHQCSCLLLPVDRKEHTETVSTCPTVLRKPGPYHSLYLRKRDEKDVRMF